MRRYAIEATTLAATTGALNVTTDGEANGRTLKTTLVAQGLAGSEEITIEVANADIDTWETLAQDDGPVALTATNNLVVVDGAVIFRLVKPTTASATSVTLYQ